MSNKNLEELQIEHFKRTVSESDREKAKEKRRLETMVQKLKDLISLTSSSNLKIKKFFLYLGIFLMSISMSPLIYGFLSRNSLPAEALKIFLIISLCCFIPGLILLIIYYKKLKKILNIAKEATNIGKQVINTLKAYQFADEENMEGTIANIESRFVINVGKKTNN